MTTSVLPDWVTSLLGTESRVVEHLGGGTSRATVLVEVPPGGRRVVARHDGGSGPLSGTAFSLAREAAAFRFAATVGVPVPAVVATAGDGMSMAVAEVSGEPETGADALDDHLSVLGRLHRAPLDDLPTSFTGFDPEGSEDLDAWSAAADECVPAPAPIIRLAIELLREHDFARPTVVSFCHGDAGPGNYLHRDGVVTGLIDWEMAHTGDPHDDLASIAVRSTLAGISLGDFGARVREHWVPASGHRPDQERYRLAVLAVLTRMVISCRAALARRDPGKDRSVQLMGLPLMEVLLLRTAAEVEGWSLPDVGDCRPAPDYVAEIRSLLDEPESSAAAPPDPGVARRRRYLSEQMRSALARDDESCGTAISTGVDAPTDLWLAAHRRLATLPASRPLAEATIPGVS